jgi:hypothetical protein
MTLYKRLLPPASCLLLAAVFTAWGFVCSPASKSTLTLKRYSSIPPIVRWTTFSSDCGVTILDPPKTEHPFNFTMSPAVCDSLERFCAAFAMFDSNYHPDQFIPNPASMDLVFARDGVVKTVRIVQFPKLPPALQALVDYATRVEYEGMERMGSTR